MDTWLLEDHSYLIACASSIEQWSSDGDSAESGWDILLLGPILWRNGELGSRVVLSWRESSTYELTERSDSTVSERLRARAYTLIDVLCRQLASIGARSSPSATRCRVTVACQSET